MSVENRLQQFIEAHSKPIRVGLVAAGGWILNACIPVQPSDINSQEPSAAITTSEALDIPQTPAASTQIEFGEVSESQLGDILNVAKEFIN